MKLKKTILIALLLLASALVGIVGRWESSSRLSDHARLPASPTGSDRRTTQDGPNTSVPSPRSKTSDLDRQLFRLLSISGSMREQGKFQLPVARELQAALDALPTEQILAILDNLDAREELSPPHEELIDFIFGTLARHDPALALDTYWDRNHTNAKVMQIRVGITFSSWTRNDLEAAAAWFEGRRAKGQLFLADGKERIDIASQLGGLLVQSFAAGNPSKAAELWSTMTEADRDASLNDDWFSQSRPDHQQAIASFLREHFDHDSEALAAAASRRLRQGPLENLDDFIDNLSPTSSERAALVSEALRTRIEESDQLRIDPTEARAWILAQAPDHAADLTGTALAQMVEWHGFAEMSDVARAYDATDATQPTFVSFLLNAPVEQKTEILRLAGGLADPEVREKVQRRFAGPP